MQKDKRLFFIIIFFLFILTRFYYITEPLWYDETEGINIANRISYISIGEYSEVSNPPLYFFYLNLVNHIIFFLKNSFSIENIIYFDIGYRLSSFIFNFISLIFFISIYKNYKEKSFLGIFLLLFAVNPFIAYYSVELRAYSLIFLLSSLNIYFFIRIIQCREKNIFFKHRENVLFQKDIIYFSILNTLFLYTHYYSIFLLSGELFLVILQIFIKKYSFYRIRNIKTFLSFIVSGFLFLPWIIYVLIHREYIHTASWMPMISFLSYIYTFDRFISGYYPLKINSIFRLKSLFNPFNLSFSIIFSGLFFIPLIGHFIKKHSNKKFKVFAFLFFFSFILIGIISIFINIFYYRNLIVLLPLFLIIWAISLDDIHRKLKNKLILIIVLLSIFSVFKQKGRVDWRSISNYLNQNISKPKNIFLADIRMRSSISYYFKIPYINLTSYKEAEKYFSSHKNEIKNEEIPLLLFYKNSGSEGVLRFFLESFVIKDKYFNDEITLIIFKSVK